MDDASITLILLAVLAAAGGLAFAFLMQWLT